MEKNIVPKDSIDFSAYELRADFNVGRMIKSIVGCAALTAIFFFLGYILHSNLGDFLNFLAILLCILLCVGMWNLFSILVDSTVKKDNFAIGAPGMAQRKGSLSKKQMLLTSWDEIKNIEIYDRTLRQGTRSTPLLRIIWTDPSKNQPEGKLMDASLLSFSVLLTDRDAVLEVAKHYLHPDRDERGRVEEKYVIEDGALSKEEYAFQAYAKGPGWLVLASPWIAIAAFFVMLFSMAARHHVHVDYLPLPFVVIILIMLTCAALSIRRHLRRPLLLAVSPTGLFVHTTNRNRNYRLPWNVISKLALYPHARFSESGITLRVDVIGNTPDETLIVEFPAMTTTMRTLTRCQIALETHHAVQMGNAAEFYHRAER